LSPEEWQDALRWTDSAHLTLEIARRHGGAFPTPIQERLTSNLANNAARTKKLEEALEEIGAAFRRSGVQYVVLKGFAHWPNAGDASLSRAQYDLDFYCRPAQMTAASAALRRLGYQPVPGFDKVALDHLPVMVRPSQWKWRGDYFDPEFPVMVDLHFRLWDEGTERIRAHGTEAFWERRTEGGRADFRFPALAPVDLIAYASLHLLRHLLRGDLRPFHVYDIAWFLHTRAADEAFWREWDAAHDHSVRRLQFVIFRLAERWFGCRLPEAVQQGIARLPRSTQRWFEVYSSAPLEAEFRPNKSELWLHFSLLDNTRDRAAVFLQRLVPSRLPPRSWRHTLARLAYHAQAFVTFCREGLRFRSALHDSKDIPPVIR
jgi:hypothetical protein